MFKRISTIFSALCFSATTVLAGLTFPVNASTTYTISTPRQFCEYVQATSISFDDDSALDCSSYSNRVGAELYLQNGLRIDDGNVVVLKDMNIDYDSIRSPFEIYDGKLVIDGGTYRTSGSCLLPIINDENDITVISGDFIAEGASLRYSQTPICLVEPEDSGEEYNAEQMKRILGPNSYFSEFGTNEEIALEQNIRIEVDFFGKEKEEVTEISAIDRTSFSIRERQEPEVVTPTPEPEPTPEPTPEIVPDLAPETDRIFIPKAPNTGTK